MENHLVIFHLQQQVEHTLAGGSPVADGEGCGTGFARQPRRGDVLPAIAVAVDDQGCVQGVGIEQWSVIRRRQAAFGVGVQQFLPLPQDHRHRLGSRLQGLFLAVAQGAFHFPHELAARPGQRQQQQAYQQQLAAQGHVPDQR